VARLSAIPRKPLHEIVIAVAGPAVNVVLAALLFPLVYSGGLPGSEDSWTEPSPAAFAATLFVANVAMVVFDSIPASLWIVAGSSGVACWAETTWPPPPSPHGSASSSHCSLSCAAPEFLSHRLSRADFYAHLDADRRICLHQRRSRAAHGAATIAEERAEAALKMIFRRSSSRWCRTTIGCDVSRQRESGSNRLAVQRHHHAV